MPKPNLFLLWQYHSIEFWMLLSTMVLTQGDLHRKTHVLQMWSFFWPQKVPGHDFKSILSEISKLNKWDSNLLSFPGKLQVCQKILSSYPIYFSFAWLFNHCQFNQIQKFIRDFLWMEKGTRNHMMFPGIGAQLTKSGVGWGSKIWESKVIPW